MVFFNYSTMQMVVKVVYYGPGLCGKTTNLEFIYSKTATNSRGEMVSLETETDRTLFFDLLPIDVGVIGGFKTKFQLYTVPGQVFYNSTRKLVLKGVDGLIFVADSQEPMLDANLESFENLKENLREIDMTIDDIPIVFQYNKRDLNNILPIDKLNSAINPMGFPFVEASAITGQGVFDTLKLISKHTLFSVKKTMTGKREDSVKVVKKPEPVEEKEELEVINSSADNSDFSDVLAESNSESYEENKSSDFFEEEDLVLDENEGEEDFQVEEEIDENVKEELKENEVEEVKPKIVIPEKQPEKVIEKSRPKKSKSIGLSVDDLMNDLMPTKQTFTKQVKFEIDKKVFKDITSATVTVDFKDNAGNVIDTKTFDSGIQKKKGIKKVLLKYLIDLIK